MRTFQEELQHSLRPEASRGLISAPSVPHSERRAGRLRCLIPGLHSSSREPAALVHH